MHAKSGDDGVLLGVAWRPFPSDCSSSTCRCRYRISLLPPTDRWWGRCSICRRAMGGSYSSLYGVKLTVNQSQQWYALHWSQTIQLTISGKKKVLWFYHGYCITWKPNVLNDEHKYILHLGQWRKRGKMSLNVMYNHPVKLILSNLYYHINIFLTCECTD